MFSRCCLSAGSNDMITCYNKCFKELLYSTNTWNFKTRHLLTYSKTTVFTWIYFLHIWSSIFLFLLLHTHICIYICIWYSHNDASNWLTVDIAKTCKSWKLSVASPMVRTLPFPALVIAVGGAAAKPCPCLATPFAKPRFHHHHFCINYFIKRKWKRN